MPIDRSLYPPNWDEIAQSVKEAAGWKCQKCGRPCKPPHLTWNDFAKQAEEKGWWVSGAYWDSLKHWILTVGNINEGWPYFHGESLVALCSGCNVRHGTDRTFLQEQLLQERISQLHLKESIDVS